MAPNSAAGKVSPPQTAAHGAEIVALGVLPGGPDGEAVASADRLGGLRLWPSLDGTREPIVIPGTTARVVALARDADGFALAMLDEAGNVHIMRISAAGAVRERIAVRGDQRALELAVTHEGFLILRADQTLELVDGAGHRRTQLAPAPGLHIATVLVRGARALALVEEGKRVHGQWIVLERGMQWGVSTPAFTVKIGRAVLSPDGDLLAAVRPRSLHPVLIDLATGAPRNVPLCVTRDWPGDEGSAGGELVGADNAPTPLGFLTQTVVACAVGGSLHWWNTSGEERPSPAGTIAIGAPFAMSDGRLVGANGPNLALSAPDSNKFLGYGLHDVARLRPGASGVLIASRDQALLLDADLRERARFELGRTSLDWRQALLVDDRTAIAASLRRHQQGFQLGVLDGVTRAYRQLVSCDLDDRDLQFEPSTGLVHASDSAGSLLFALDPRTRTLGKPARIASWLRPSRIALVDPGLTGGLGALEIDDTDDGAIVGEFPLVDIQPGATIQPRTTYRVPGDFRTSDRAGRLYMHSRDSEEVLVYERGRLVARLPGLVGMALHPSPDGSLIAALGSPSLVLLTASGQVRWESAHWNTSDVVWTSSGELVAHFSTGVATVDLRTGALVQRRCGWSFGLSDGPFDVGDTGPSICEVAR